jgi:hypothetical protein
MTPPHAFKNMQHCNHDTSPQRPHLTAACKRQLPLQQVLAYAQVPRPPNVTPAEWFGDRPCTDALSVQETAHAMQRRPTGLSTASARAHICRAPCSTGDEFGQPSIIACRPMMRLQPFLLQLNVREARVPCRILLQTSNRPQRRADRRFVTGERSWSRLSVS